MHEKIHALFLFLFVSPSSVFRTCHNFERQNLRSLNFMQFRNVDRLFMKLHICEMFGRE